MNDTKWDELRLAMYHLGDRHPRWRTKDISGYVSDWDGEWFYHFRQGGYLTIEWVEIQVSWPDQDAAVLELLQQIHVPGHRIENGFRVYGFARQGTQATRRLGRARLQRLSARVHHGPGIAGGPPAESERPGKNLVQHGLGVKDLPPVGKEGESPVTKVASQLKFRLTQLSSAASMLREKEWGVNARREEVAKARAMLLSELTNSAVPPSGRYCRRLGKQFCLPYLAGA